MPTKIRFGPLIGQNSERGMERGGGGKGQTPFWGG